MLGPRLQTVHLHAPPHMHSIFFLKNVHTHISFGVVIPLCGFTSARGEQRSQKNPVLSVGRVRTGRREGEEKQNDVSMYSWLHSQGRRPAHLGNRFINSTRNHAKKMGYSPEHLTKFKIQLWSLIKNRNLRQSVRKAGWSCVRNLEFRVCLSRWWPS